MCFLFCVCVLYTILVWTSEFITVIKFPFLSSTAVNMMKFKQCWLVITLSTVPQSLLIHEPQIGANECCWNLESVTVLTSDFQPLSPPVALHSCGFGEEPEPKQVTVLCGSSPTGALSLYSANRLQIQIKRHPGWSITVQHKSDPRHPTKELYTRQNKMTG